MATGPRFHAVTDADALVAAGLAKRVLLEPAAPAPDPSPSYGEVRTPVPGNQPLANPLLRYVFHDAVVHGPEGVISVGRHVVRESLFHVSPARSAAWTDGALWLALHCHVGSTLHHARHLLCGNPGNYFHWLLDGAARVCVGVDDGLALLPWTGAAFQTQAGWLPRLGQGVLLQPHQAVHVRRLSWVSSLTAMGGAFHPALRRLRGPQADRPKAIYVARTDASQRPLRNEAEVQRLCQSRGFAPVVPGRMPMAEQAAVFSAARRIVAPHGAGLANLVFCHPAAALLELMMDQYANFCFRRLSACMGVHWGCVIGQAEPGGDPDWVHGTSWTMDLDRLAAALDDPAFQPTTTIKES